MNCSSSAKQDSLASHRLEMTPQQYSLARQYRAATQLGAGDCHHSSSVPSSDRQYQKLGRPEGTTTTQL